MVAEGAYTARVTVDEWRALERISDVKHEYKDGHLYAMAGGSQTHSRIAVNAIAALDAALGDGPCMVYNSDMATRIFERRYTYPDVVVAYEGSGIASREKTELEAPRVVFEVLSDGTERKDRGSKWDDYRRCASLQEYVLVGAEYRRVEVYRRTEQGRGLFQIYGPGDLMEPSSIGVRLPVAALYRRTDVPETSPE